MPALARVQVQVQGRGGQGSSDWLVGRWKNTKEREAPTPHQGRASRNTGLEASSVPPVSGTKHSRVDGPGSTFKTHLNLGKPRVLAELFFKGKKKKRKKKKPHVENQLRGACIIQELPWQSGRQPWAGICLPTQQGPPPFLLVPPPRPSFLLASSSPQ